jgi:hypothetical protein
MMRVRTGLGVREMHTIRGRTIDVGSVVVLGVVRGMAVLLWTVVVVVVVDLAGSVDGRGRHPVGHGDVHDGEVFGTGVGAVAKKVLVSVLGMSVGLVLVYICWTRERRGGSWEWEGKEIERAKENVGMVGKEIREDVYGMIWYGMDVGACVVSFSLGSGQ